MKLHRPGAAGQSLTDVQNLEPEVLEKGSGRPRLRSGGLTDELCLSWGENAMPRSAADLSPPLLSLVHCLWCLDISINYTKLKGACFFSD